MNGVKAATPEAAARQLGRRMLRNGFALEAVHEYRHQDGTPSHWRIRMKHPDGRKWIRPMRHEIGFYLLQEPPAPATGKPVYGLERLAADPSATVLVVEGEWAADHLHRIGIIAATSGGADSADAADWAPLAGRRVRVWPDNDRAGAKYGKAVAERLQALGCAVEITQVAALDLPPKGDAVDWLARHPDATAADVLALAPEPRRDEEAPRGAAILDDVYSFLGRFVAYPSEHAQVAHTLWIAHTHGMDLWDSTPRIAFISPEPGSGKSRALEATELLVPRAVEAVNVTPAYLFRKVAAEDGRPTILYDEIDTVFGPRAKDNEEIRGLLNAGHRKHSVAGRCVVRGKEVFTEEIPAYCAVALAGLHGLPDTIASRSIIVKMRRRAPHERVEPYRRRINGPEAEKIGARLASWIAGIEPQWPEMPDEVTDRDADVWEAPLMIADAAGEGWPERARVAAVALVADARASTPSLGILLLADLRKVFGHREVMSTEMILNDLHAIEESPWGDIRGKPLDARGLSYRLRGYGIAPRNVRIGDTIPKGYRREDLHDAWERYLPLPQESSATSATSATNATGHPRVADVADVADASRHTEVLEL